MAEDELFSGLLARHGRGTLDQEATAALADVVKGVQDLGKKGSVVLTIVVEPAGSGGRTVAVGGRVEGKAPRPDPELGVYYPDHAGELHRDDPYQDRLPGTQVPQPDEPVRAVAPDDTAPRAIEGDAELPRALPDDEEGADRG